MEDDKTGARPRAGWWAFAATVFTSAFLVFQVQPLVSKHVLPWYGGASAVWTTCLLVFQVLLFAGYLHAHLLGRLDTRWQASAHVLLLLVAAAISILPSEEWKPSGAESPLLRIVLMLVLTVGLPYFALSATGPLLQVWFWRAHPGRSPYPLYALSNAGSLLALVSYPFLVEPNLSTPSQAVVWRSVFVVFVLLCSACALLVRRSDATEGASPDVDANRPEEESAPNEHTARFSTMATRLLWLGWSACSVILFMSVTNQLTLNVASVPFLWILPLSVYLLTFILAFGWPGAYPKKVAGLLLAVAVFGLALLTQLEVDYSEHRPGTVAKIALAAAALFVTCFVCHGELYRLRPEPRKLTSFYLWVAFGGALGGTVVAVVAPLVFLLYQELHVGLVLCCVLYLVVLFRDPAGVLSGPRRRWMAVPILLGLLGLQVMLSLQAADMLQGALETRRNFFGLLRVTETQAGTAEHALELWDGSTLHGYQLLEGEKRGAPTLYYAPDTGVGHVMDHRDDAPRKIGLVGLGAGTLAAYGRPQDELRFYEISPDVVELATETFGYVSSCRARWDVVLGDARLRLEEEPDQGFDVLVLDAFSSDAIPAHLLTVEAFDVYRRHLKPGGVIAVHVSNTHLELSTILYPLAEHHGLFAMEIRNISDRATLTAPAIWMVLTANLDYMKTLTERLRGPVERGEAGLTNTPAPANANVRAWTDTRSNLFEILR